MVKRTVRGEEVTEREGMADQDKKAEAGAAVVEGSPKTGEQKQWLTKSVERKMTIDSLPPKMRTAPFDPYMFPLGAEFPEKIPVFIEVSAGSRNKYEWNQEVGVMMLDRVLHSAVHYPESYGFVSRTLCGDGDPLDVLVMGTQPLAVGCVVYARPIAYMVMEDEKGMDEKVLAVLSNDAHFSHIQCFEDIAKHKLAEVSNFFETYKSLEKNKWAKVGGWHNTEETYALLRRTNEAFLEQERLLSSAEEQA